MAKYFFDFIDGDYKSIDQDGHTHPSPESAKEELLKVLVEIYAHGPIDTDHRKVLCAVRDDDGAVIYRASLTLECSASSTVPHRSLLSHKLLRPKIVR